jgi:hypothetical protein
MYQIYGLWAVVNVVKATNIGKYKNYQTLSKFGNLGAILCIIII